MRKGRHVGWRGHGAALGLLGLVAAPAPAQDLANTLRLGTAAAVQRAAEALDHPDATHLGGLLVLLRAGRGHDDARGVAAELAFAVLGWWSLRDAGVADALFDAVEGARGRDTERDVLWLAAIGERPPTPRAAIGYSGGAPGMAELCDPETMFLSLTSTMRAPAPTTWPERCGLCVEALRALGPQLEPALPLLRWAAPRRPGVATLLPPTPR